MLMLFSDVSENDAPTIIYERSHLDVARLLYQHGDSGLSFMDLAGKLEDLPARKEVLATGKAGTVYLCHPFLVHAAQRHKGNKPKFMAQAPLILRGEFCISDAKIGNSAVEKAIQLALGDYRAPSFS